MLNRDSSVKSTWPHCSGVHLVFTGQMQPRSDVCWGQRHANNRSSCEQLSFMQSVRHSLTGYGPSCSIRELRRQKSCCAVTAGLRFMLILVGYLHSAMQPLPHM
ncbi:hypothetical protein AVEN_259147-1 [Araneus ventricosus]|uniref:Uncharacterized protein n=1 Tax=Araneus ventricosus TaxID=182803 RepID=A0A4Y2JS75_ARAVE|nr:hypothetical protein AVEN_259147-1 [Araneus ventricosus]